MSMSQGNASDGSAGGGGAGGGYGRNDGGGGRGHGGGGNGRGPGGPHRNNKKRRRQRPQRQKRRGGGGGGGSKEHSLDFINRERMFQHVEGLLRQIREQAEEFGGYSEEQLNDYTQLVVNFNRQMEEEGETSAISERNRSEYMRVRDKLNNALKN